MIRILMVCAGNICRSPMAEAVFKHKLADKELSQQFEVDSAGTGNWHLGEPAHPRTLQILRAQAIPYNGRARQLIAEDLNRFDYILAMDSSNLASIRKLGSGTAQVRLFLSFANALGLSDAEEVPDPYYNGHYDEVYALVDKGSDALLTYLEKRQA